MKRRKLWVAPAILLFGAVDSRGDETSGAETDCLRQGSTCNESVVRYGEDCGIRNYGHCRPRNNKDCSPARIGSACYPGRAVGHCAKDADMDGFPDLENQDATQTPESPILPDPQSAE